MIFQVSGFGQAPALEAPTAICLERNRYRDVADRVPDFSIEHMAEVFEWPPHGGNSWEAQDSPPCFVSLEGSSGSW